MCFVGQQMISKFQVITIRNNFKMDSHYVPNKNYKNEFKKKKSRWTSCIHKTFSIGLRKPDDSMDAGQVSSPTSEVELFEVILH